jgi:DNA-binding NarL/FixJ family response regulator
MTGRICFAATLTLFVLRFTLAQAADTKAPEAKKKPVEAQAAEPLKFIRVLRDAHDRPLALETAVAHYVPTAAGKQFSVDLIGCIHVADTKYYEALNERFKQYDAVLFELVMPEGQSLAGLGERKSDHPIARVQQSLPKILDLDYQLKRIDYTAKNFVHADLSPDEMAKAIKSRGDSGGSVFIKVFFDLLKESNHQAEVREKKGGDFTEFQLLAALFDSNRPLALKRLMADQMELVESGTGLGPTLDTILVQDRNAAAMRALAREIKKGTAKIAIFYGAAHMPDLDRRLTEELKLKRQTMTWDRAWELSGK